MLYARPWNVLLVTTAAGTFQGRRTQPDDSCEYRNKCYIKRTRSGSVGSIAGLQWLFCYHSDPNSDGLDEYDTPDSIASTNIPSGVLSEITN